MLPQETKKSAAGTICPLSPPPLLLQWRLGLSDRRQGVVLNGQSSNWFHLETDVPQGSILGLLLVLAYLNLPEGLFSVSQLFADDTSLFQMCMILKQH